MELPSRMALSSRSRLDHDARKSSRTCVHHRIRWDKSAALGLIGIGVNDPRFSLVYRQQVADLLGKSAGSTRGRCTGVGSLRQSLHLRR